MEKSNFFEHTLNKKSQQLLGGKRTKASFLSVCVYSTYICVCDWHCNIMWKQTVSSSQVSQDTFFVLYIYFHSSKKLRMMHFQYFVIGIHIWSSLCMKIDTNKILDKVVKNLFWKSKHLFLVSSWYQDFFCF